VITSVFGKRGNNGIKQRRLNAEKRKSPSYEKYARPSRPSFTRK